MVSRRRVDSSGTTSGTWTCGSRPSISAIERHVPGLAPVIQLLAQPGRDLVVDARRVDRRVVAPVEREDQPRAAPGRPRPPPRCSDIAACRRPRGRRAASALCTWPSEAAAEASSVEARRTAAPVGPELGRHAPAHERPAHRRCRGSAAGPARPRTRPAARRGWSPASGPPSSAGPSARPGPRAARPHARPVERAAEEAGRRRTAPPARPRHRRPGRSGARGWPGCSRSRGRPGVQAIAQGRTASDVFQLVDQPLEQAQAAVPEARVAGVEAERGQQLAWRSVPPAPASRDSAARSPPAAARRRHRASSRGSRRTRRHRRRTATWTKCGM